MTSSATDQSMLSGKRDLSITLRLLILALSVVLPIIGFSAFVIIHYAAAQRADIEANVRQSLHGFALDVERELAGVTRAATLLAVSSSPLRAQDLEGFHRQAREAVKVEGIEITLSDMTGQQLVSTARDYGQTLPKLADIDRVKAAFDGDAPRVSGITTSAVLERSIVAVDV